MNTVGSHIIPQATDIPQGWYEDPVRHVGQRYWDGHQWTEHVAVSGQQYTSPLPVAIKAKKKIYWSNLFRFRVWWFSLTSGIVISVVLLAIGLPPALTTAVFLLSVVGVGYFWMTQQMACNYCGTALRVTRLTGGQKVCQKCGNPTDAQ